MNNDNRANDANDKGKELFVGLMETERQEMLQRKLEFERERQVLLQELLHLRQDTAEAWIVVLERRQQLPQVRAFETHVLVWQQQQ